MIDLNSCFLLDTIMYHSYNTVWHLIVWTVSKQQRLPSTYQLKHLYFQKYLYLYWSISSLLDLVLVLKYIFIVGPCTLLKYIFIVGPCTCTEVYLHCFTLYFTEVYLHCWTLYLYWSISSLFYLVLYWSISSLLDLVLYWSISSLFYLVLVLVLKNFWKYLSFT